MILGKSIRLSPETVALIRDRHDPFGFALVNPPRPKPISDVRYQNPCCEIELPGLIQWCMLGNPMIGYKFKRSSKSIKPPRI